MGPEVDEARGILGERPSAWGQRRCRREPRVCLVLPRECWGGEFPRNGTECSARPPFPATFLLPGRQCPHLCLLSFLASCHPFQSAPHACSRTVSTSQGARGPGFLPETLALPWPSVWPAISMSASGPSPALTAVAEVPGQVALGAAEREPVQPGVEAAGGRGGARSGCTQHGGGAGCWARCWEPEPERPRGPDGEGQGDGKGRGGLLGPLPGDPAGVFQVRATSMSPYQHVSSWWTGTD